jgi:hypothetical protein
MLRGSSNGSNLCVKRLGQGWNWGGFIGETRGWTHGLGYARFSTPNALGERGTDGCCCDLKPPPSLKLQKQCGFVARIFAATVAHEPALTWLIIFIMYGQILGKSCDGILLGNGHSDWRVIEDIESLMRTTMDSGSRWLATMDSVFCLVITPL